MSIFYYPALRRKPSTSPDRTADAATSNQPYFSSALHESPKPASHPSFDVPSSSPLPQSPDAAGPSSPHTPRTRKRSSFSVFHRDLARVDETPDVPSRANEGTTGGSRAPLIAARDFAYESSSSVFESGRRRESPTNETPSEMSVVVDAPVSAGPLTSPLSPDQQPGRPMIDPAHIPPASVHDSYLSKYLLQINAQPAPDISQPPRGPARHALSPDAPSSGDTEAILLPSALDDSSPNTAGAQAPSKGQDRKPTYEMFNAKSTTSPSDLTRALQGHLEEVLAAQEEIGRMHLALEGIGFGDSFGVEEDDTGGESSKGTPGKGTRGGGRKKKDDGLKEREKAVDELMERLGKMSEGLRTYHELGTPRIIFPENTQANSTTGNHPGAGPMDSPNGPISPAPHRVSPSTTRHLAQPHSSSPFASAPSTRSRYVPSQTDRAEPSDYPSLYPGAYRSSPNVDVPTAVPETGISPQTNHGRQGDFEILSPASLGFSPVDRVYRSRSTMDGNANEMDGRERSRGEEAWLEHTRRDVEGIGGSNGRGFQQGAVEMVDRSRPW